MDTATKVVDYKRVLVSDISPSMVLAKSVVTKEGIVLLPQNTMLNANSCRKLLSNNIREVFVKVEGAREDVEPITSEEISQLEEQVVATQDKEEFKEFVSAYQETNEEVKETLKDIGNGQTIDLDKLYHLTNNIMDTLKCKSDIFTYIGFLEEYDESTFTHSSNVSLLCNLFAKWLGFSEEEKMYLTTAGILHDVGKTRVPPDTLNKQTKLTDDEFSEIKKHALYGYRIMESQQVPMDIKLAALMHHEKIDGTGYPIGAKQEQINRFAKIVAICDIYDAMTATRAYRKKILPFDVIKTFENNCYGQLDTKYLLIFLQNIAYNYIGSWVKLSNNENAEIVFINRNNLSRPMVRVGREIIDLSRRNDLYIKDII